MASVLILFRSTMWGEPLDTSMVPEGFEFTTDRRRFAEASAVVFHIPAWRYWRFSDVIGWRWLLGGVKRPGQLWVAWSMECEAHYPLLRDAAFMRHFDITMTYRLDADVPMTYIHDHGLRQAPQPKLAAPLVAAFVSSRVDRSGRERYLRELARHMPIDSYGTFLRNRSLPQDSGHATKLETIARYKFCVAFENARARDYVTEKFFDPLAAGSVPVYLGAPNIDDIAPGEHCFVRVDEFPDPKALAEYLIALGRDEAAYQAYFAWKEKPYRAAFQRLLALNEPHPFARLCALIQARLKRQPSAPKGQEE
jgi:hypothetical protein